MHVIVRHFDELTAAQLDTWAQFQQAEAALESPYFRPEFTRCVASVRNDVRVAVLSQHGQPAGFFPFQLAARRVARPVAARLSDYQGVICRPGLAFDAAELIRRCGLSAWHFDHLIASQQPFQPFHRLTDLSPQLDLSGGWDAYCGSLRKSGADELRQTLRKARKLDRELGPLRFELHAADPGLLDLLVDWKSQQYRRTRVMDVFAFEWTVELLRAVVACQDESFAGLLSVLFCGDRPVAMHLGMRSFGVLHWWFPSYDWELARYSPGRVLLVQLIKTAAASGIRTIDLGRGVAPYKARAMSSAVRVAEGSVDLRPLARRLRHGWANTKDWIRSSPIYGPTRVPARILYQVREWMAFR